MIDIAKEFQSKNCAQIVLKYFGYDEYLDFANGFGGGFSKGLLCGSIAASIAVLGMKFKDEILKEKISLFYLELDKFNKERNCKNLLGGDPNKNDEFEKILKDDKINKICVPLTSKCIEIIEKIL